MNVGFVLAVIFSAFITGGLARFALPGPDPMPAWLTIVIGLIGSLVGAIVGDTLSNGNGYAVSFVSFGVAIALVAAYRVFVQKRPVFGPGALKFPERGVGVENYRERLRKLGFDPDNLQPARPQMPTREDRLRAAIEELHHADLIDDEERERLVERLDEPTPGQAPA
ncbi:MAG TPA: hypothetical protein VGU02_15135 [Gaiellaceae bacterium]|nr:hypothetical protein [Gaiellaceae bacterium]